MTAQLAAHLALAGFALYCAAWAIYDWAGHAIDRHVEAALAPDFFDHVTELRTDFEPCPLVPLDVPLLEWIAANELRPFFAEWSALAEQPEESA